MTSEADDPYVASCFVSYNHADSSLARGIAEGLEQLGYYVWIDRGQLKVGDSLVEAIGDAIDQVDFLIALVSEGSVASNWCKKELSLAMTGEVNRHGIAVLPCRVGDVPMPPSLADKFYLEVDLEDAAATVANLDQHMRLYLQPAAPIPRRRPKLVSGPRIEPGRRTSSSPAAIPAKSPSVQVRMTGVDLNRVTAPRNDGTRGSALYKVPITLSSTPDRVWRELFVQTWNMPPRWTSMHRPGIALVQGSSIVLDGTTMEELEKYHLETLRHVVDKVNHDRQVLADREAAAKAREAEERGARAVRDAEIANRLKFD